MKEPRVSEGLEVRFEKTDADPGVIFRWSLGLGLVTAATAGILIWVLVFMRRQEEARDPARPSLYFAEEKRQPPGVALQTSPFRDLGTLRAKEREELTTPGWVDQPGGVARIPIDRAMQIYVQRQGASEGTWPPRNAANPDDSPTDEAPVPPPASAATPSPAAAPPPAAVPSPSPHGDHE